MAPDGRGKKAKIARNARPRCPECGEIRSEEGTLALYNSISYIVFNSEKRPFVTLGNSMRCRVCLGCGRVELFAPVKALRETSGKGTSGKREG